MLPSQVLHPVLVVLNVFFPREITVFVVFLTKHPWLSIVESFKNFKKKSYQPKHKYVLAILYSYA